MQGIQDPQEDTAPMKTWQHANDGPANWAAEGKATNTCHDAHAVVKINDAKGSAT